MKKFDWLIVLFIVGVFSIVFFSRLGWLTLQSFDEAWYAVIARNILIRSNPLQLWFNGTPFIDHPPLGFWLMAMAYRLFGISEFTTRAVSALTGVGSLLLLYGVGKQLVHRNVGLMASLMLGSSLWFVYRARSGNLDVPLLFFYLLTVFLGLLYQKKRKLAVLVGLAFGCLLLIKTLVGVSAGIVLLFLLVSSKYSRKAKIKDGVLAGLATFVTILPWYGYNAIFNSGFLYHHFIEIGLRAGNSDFVSQGLQIKKILLYLHSGVGRWYTLSLAGVVFLSLFFTKHKRLIAFLFLWLLVVGGPFLLNEKTEIWHLLPLYPPLFLSAATAFYYVSERLSRYFQNRKIKNVVLVAPLCMVFALAAFQLRQIWQLVVPLDRYVPTIDQIAQSAGALPGQLYLKEVVGPEVIYYSGKNVISFGLNPDSFEIMRQALSNSKERVLMIVPANDLPTLDAQQVKYVVLEQNTDYALISNDSVYLPESQ
ncbi:glycosyltransferase family 39 protein [Candidatus Woesebacteria bacterium]|nr:glycosyltransferase family 39 protein [Candidatus Woesebacteria bacterium]